MGSPLDENSFVPGHTPEDALLNAEQAALIQRALASLPDRQRDVVVARDVDGRRPPEIAAALGLSLGAVDSLLLRARRRLAASVQSMSAEGGAANFATTAAVSAVGGGASQYGAIGRLAQIVGDAIAAASYHVAVAAGMVPGMPSLAAQVAPAAAAGLVALAPSVGGATQVPAVPVVPAISATVPAAPQRPEVPVAAPSVLTTEAPPVAAPAAPSVAPPDRAVTPAVATPPRDDGAPGPLSPIGKGLGATVRGLTGHPSGR